MQGPELSTLNYGSRAWQSRTCITVQTYLTSRTIPGTSPGSLDSATGRTTLSRDSWKPLAGPPWTSTSYVRARTILTLLALCVVQYSWTRTAKYMASQNYLTGGTNNEAGEWLHSLTGRAGGMPRGLSESDKSRLIGGVPLHRPANSSRRRPRCDNHPHNRIDCRLFGRQARGPKY